jgi:hypothetical protein
MYTAMNPLTVKGLENQAGQHNCFLNVVVQSLWHLPAIRNTIISISHHCRNDACILCAIKSIFEKFKNVSESKLSPNILRQRLSVTFANQNKFQLGSCEDATEALTEILNNIHNITTSNADKDCKNSCPIHSVAGLELVEQIECLSCRASDEPQTLSTFVHYAYVDPLCDIYRKNPECNFDNLLRDVDHQDVRECPNSQCPERWSREGSDSARCHILRYLLNIPKVFIIGFVWPSDAASVTTITTLLRSIRLEVNLSNIYTRAENCRFIFWGMICYYGAHYCCYFYNPTSQRWYMFDDEIVREVGTSWREVKERCQRSHLQPSLLFYEKYDPQQAAFYYQATENDYIEMNDEFSSAEPDVMSMDTTDFQLPSDSIHQNSSESLREKTAISNREIFRNNVSSNQIKNREVTNTNKNQSNTPPYQTLEPSIRIEKLYPNIKRKIPIDSGGNVLYEYSFKSRKLTEDDRPHLSGSTNSTRLVQSGESSRQSFPYSSVNDNNHDRNYGHLFNSSSRDGMETSWTNSMGSSGRTNETSAWVSSSLSPSANSVQPTAPSEEFINSTAMSSAHTITTHNENKSTRCFLSFEKYDMVNQD